MSISARPLTLLVSLERRESSMGIIIVLAVILIFGLLVDPYPTLAVVTLPITATLTLCFVAIALCIAIPYECFVLVRRMLNKSS